MLDVKLLGRFSVARDGRPLAIPSRPAQLLLAYLLLNAGAPQPREALADTLWPDSAADNARANLRHALWQLRAALDDADDPQAGYIVHNAHDIAFNRHSGYRLDVDTLERERPAWTTAALLEAAAAYAGELLPGFYESWIVPERERLALLFNRRMGRLLERLMAEQRWDETLAWAERWIDLDGAPEPAYRALMRSYAVLGDAGQVMVAFRRCHEALREQLGIEPSPETRLLVESLTHGVAQAVPNSVAHSGQTPAKPRPAAAVPGMAAEHEPVPPRAAGGDRQLLAAALARAAAERQRANGYRLAAGLLGVLAAALGAALAGRRWRR